eukprot:g1117.t1
MVKSRKAKPSSKKKVVKRANHKKNKQRRPNENKNKNCKNVTKSKSKKENPTAESSEMYIVKHSSHIVTVGRMRLDEALATGNTKGWSDARIKAFVKRKTNPNSYYYRFNDPGETQRSGGWTEDEKKNFFNRLKELGGANGQWGIFAMGIPGRVGYQCSNYYRKLIEKGEVKDPNYIVDENGKAHFLHKRKRSGKSKGKDDNDGDKKNENNKRRKKKTNSSSSAAKGNGKVETFSESAKEALEVWKTTEYVAQRSLNLKDLQRRMAVCVASKPMKGTHLFRCAKVNGEKFEVGDFVWIERKNGEEEEEEEEGSIENVERYVLEVTRIWKEPIQGNDASKENSSEEWTVIISGLRLYSKKEILKEAPSFFGSLKSEKHPDNELFLSFEEVNVPGTSVCKRARVTISRRKVAAFETAVSSKLNATYFSGWTDVSRLHDQYFLRYIVDIKIGWMTMCLLPPAAAKKARAAEMKRLEKKSNGKGKKTKTRVKQTTVSDSTPIPPVRFTLRKLISKREEFLRKQRRAAANAEWKIRKSEANEAKAKEEEKRKLAREQFEKEQSEGSTVKLSDYEKDRLQRIAENDAFLRQLGIGGEAPGLLNNGGES